MLVEITEQKRDLLRELIETAEQAAIQGVDHADKRAYKDLLRSRLRLLESLMAKLRNEAKS